MSKNPLEYPGHSSRSSAPTCHRAREPAADRIGYVGTAHGALHMLARGSARLNAAMNADAFAAPEMQVPAATGFLLHVFSGYPRLPARP